MKRIFFNKNYNNLAIGMMFFGLTLVLSACFLPAGCAKIINPATGVATETIDWTKTSTYYHNFLTGLTRFFRNAWHGFMITNNLFS